MLYERRDAGERVVNSASAWNAAMAAAEDYVRRQNAGLGSLSIGGYPTFPAHTVLVLNERGSKILAGSPVVVADRYVDPLIKPIGFPYELPLLRAPFVTQQLRETLDLRFGVAIETIPVGEIGPVCVGGVCVASYYAGPEALDRRDYGYLYVVADGSAASFGPTTKLTSIQLLNSPHASSFSLIRIGSAPWCLRALSALSGATEGPNGDRFSDGFELHEAIYRNPPTDVTIPDSRIRIPRTGVYDLRSIIHMELDIDNGGRIQIETALPYLEYFSSKMHARIIVENSTILHPVARWFGAGVNVPVLLVAHPGGNNAFICPKKTSGCTSLDTRMFLTAGSTVAVRLIFPDWPVNAVAARYLAFGSLLLTQAVPEVWYQPTPYSGSGTASALATPVSMSEFDPSQSYQNVG
jgi:hypothetical protein